MALVPVHRERSGYTKTGPVIEAMATNKLVSHNDRTMVATASNKKEGTVSLAVERLKYKRWLLYVRPSTSACIEAMQLAIQVDSDIHIADVDQIPKSKMPPWLTGVPTLVDLVTKRGPYMGSEALEQLRQYVSSEPLPISSVTKQYFKLGERGDTEQEWGGFAPKHDFIMPDLSKDPRYESTGSITQQHVSALQRARGSDDEVLCIRDAPSRTKTSGKSPMQSGSSQIGSGVGRIKMY